jgi:hypothetical protein
MAVRWFGNLVFFDGQTGTVSPYAWLVPPSTSVNQGTANNYQMTGAVIDALGRLVAVERTSSNQATFRVSTAGLVPALFTIATTDAEVAN